MILYYPLCGLVIGIAATVLGIFVYTRNPKSMVNKTFLMFCGCLAVWHYNYFLWLMSDNPKSALFFVRMLTIGPIFIPGTLLHYVLSFLDLNRGRRRKILIYGYIVDFIFLSFVFSPLFISGLRKVIFIEYFTE